MSLLKKVRRLKGGVGLAVCKCGHLQSEHSSLLLPLVDDKMYREYHHGSCVSNCCSCKRFTFDRFVSLEEAAYIIEEAVT